MKQLTINSVLECDLLLEGLNARLAVGFQNGVTPQLPALNIAMQISNLAGQINQIRNELQAPAVPIVPGRPQLVPDDGVAGA